MAVVQEANARIPLLQVLQIQVGVEAVADMHTDWEIRMLLPEVAGQDWSSFAMHFQG